MSVRAVVFAYHDVGVRCLQALLSGGIEVPLVVTHRDDPEEKQWFASVAHTAVGYDLPTIMPQGAECEELAGRIAAIAPDFIFSFYYRNLIDEKVLGCARRGALNMHGSLLPKYRGRAPVNWAIVKGERETGATLHYMVARADAGDIVDQMSVPILIDDDALAVFRKVTVAAEIVLARSLPGLVSGTAARTPQRIEAGAYFGRRRPEDGRIDWRQSALEIHNLVRAVAPPFPGAYAEVNGERWFLHRTHFEKDRRVAPGAPRLFADQGRCYLACRDGGVLRVLAAATAAGSLDLKALTCELGTQQRLLG